VPQGNFSIYVYKDNDIVSQHLAGESHSYEKPEVDAVLWALQQYKPPQQQQQGAGAASPLMSQALMVDVGANVGTFLFKVADAGYRVAAFEGAGQTTGSACMACTACSVMKAQRQHVGAGWGHNIARRQSCSSHWLPED
jgi:hypothetical protein